MNYCVTKEPSGAYLVEARIDDMRVDVIETGLTLEEAEAYAEELNREEGRRQYNREYESNPER